MPMPRNVHFTRSLAVLRLKRQLEQASYPRIQMGLIVSLTGAAGLLCSFVLLRAGVDTMSFRYPLALVGAYLFFLFLLWLWLRTRADDYLDLPDPANLAPVRGSGGTTSPIHSWGGDFGGGGASGSFEGSSPVSLMDSEPLPSIGDAASSAVDVDELAIPIVVLVLAIGLALASLYVVYLAPTLFAELLFDGTLSYTLYRHLRATDTRHWLTTAMRRTALPFGLTAVFLVAVGAAMAAYAPGARSIGEVMHHAHARL
jgi:hypothetical protein